MAKTSETSIEEIQRDIEKQKDDFDKELQQRIKALEKESKAFAKDIKKFSQKNRTLANSLSDPQMREVISAAGALLQTGFLKQFEQQQKLIAEQFAQDRKVQRSMCLPEIEEVLNGIAQPVLPDRITRTRARALIATHSGIDYDQVEKLPVSHYLELFKHAIEVEKSRNQNQPIEALEKRVNELNELVEGFRELSAEGQDFQKEKEKLESQVKVLNIELSVRNTKILQQKKQIKKQSGLEYRFDPERLRSLIDETRKRNGKQNHTQIAKKLGCHRDTVKKHVKLLGLTAY